jgi:hypothetical protein
MINSELSEKQEEEEEEKKDAYTIQKQLWQLCLNSYEVTLSVTWTYH